MTFAQAFPMIKMMLEAKNTPSQLALAEQVLANQTDSDDALIQGMLEEQPHVHGPDCNHGPIEIEI